MTACATEPAAENQSENENGNDWTARPACVITADGTYAARLALDGESWYPERWTLDGPEPYAVPLPGHQPEEPGTEVLPLTDGRVLIHRLTDGRHVFSLLYPTGPGTGELPLGAVECPDEGTRLRLLPPAPGGVRAYALAVGRDSTAVWLVAGGAFGPEHLAEVPGRCAGGVWLDGTGRLLALDRFQYGRTKTVVVDLERGGEVSPLLQIAEYSNDRLLLADAGSGLLLIRSDAPSPGHDRLGWGVLGSTLPVRFPDCLRATDCAVTPFAIQPGQVLTPETCAVALRIDGPAGTWLGIWRPAERQVHHFPAPEGWLAGAGLWTKEGVLQLPYATGAVPCGVARVGAPTRMGEGGPVRDAGQGPEPHPPPRPVPLQQAPLRGRVAHAPRPPLGDETPQAGNLLARPTRADDPAPTGSLLAHPTLGSETTQAGILLARPTRANEAAPAGNLLTRPTLGNATAQAGSLPAHPTPGHATAQAGGLPALPTPGHATAQAGGLPALPTPGEETAQAGDLLTRPTLGNETAPTGNLPARPAVEGDEAVNAASASPGFRAEAAQPRWVLVGTVAPPCTRPALDDGTVSPTPHPTHPRRQLFRPGPTVLSLPGD